MLRRIGWICTTGLQKSKALQLEQSGIQITIVENSLGTIGLRKIHWGTRYMCVDIDLHIHGKYGRTPQ